ncbi:MAG: ATP-binding protein [Chitinivibrionales bacterium]
MKVIALFRRPVSFRVVMIVYVVIPLTVALGVFGFFTLSTIEGQVVDQMQKDLELVARAIRLPLSYALEKERMGSLQQSLESVFAIGRVYGAYVYDRDGKEVLRIGQHDPETNTRKLNKVASKGRRYGEYGRVGGRQVYSYFVPLTDQGGRINGLLHLTRKESEFREHIQSIRVKGAISLGVLFLVFSAVVFYGLHYGIGRHLDRLSATMADIARGQRKQRFSLAGPREIMQLGTAFNHMLCSIEAAESEVADHRTKQEHMEKEIRQMQKLAALGRLAAGTAHELGTPLSVISGKAQRALRRKDISHYCSQSLQAIRQEVARMEYIIRQLLDFSRRNPLRCGKCVPAHLLASAVSAVRYEAESNGTTITTDQSRGGDMMILDPMRVEQALVNLLRNAIQCRVAGTVRCGCLPAESGMVFRVDDDGPGVPEQIRAHIFDPFFTTKSVGKGTGLGLSIVHTVAAEHGGEIRLTNSELGGSCFELFVRNQARTG